MMEQRQMGRQDIAVGRKMRGPLRIEPGEIGRPKNGGDDDRCGDRQIST
jgi:hypothetical protein